MIVPSIKMPPLAISEGDLQSVYRTADTEELIDRVSSGALTPHAHRLALQELSFRGVSIDGLRDAPEQEEELHRRAPPPFLTRCWRGEAPLWMAFWVVGLIRGLAIGFVLAVVGIEHGRLALLAAYLLLGIPVEALWIVSVYRCGNQAESSPWRGLALIAVILKVAFVLLMVAGGLLLPRL